MRKYLCALGRGRAYPSIGPAIGSTPPSVRVQRFRNNPALYPRVLGLVLAAGLASSASADIYRWVDGTLIPGTEGKYPGAYQYSFFTDLSNLTLSYADFRDFYFPYIYSTFAGSTLDHADFSYSVIYSSNFTNADLSNANLTSTTLSDSNFTNADLTGAILTGADITGADLSNTGLTTAQLTSTLNYQYRLSYGGPMANLGLAGASLAGIDLSGSYVGYSNFSDADLASANLAGAYLFGANLTNADLTNTNLDFANLYGVTGYTGTAAGLSARGTILPNGSIESFTLMPGETWAAVTESGVGTSPYTLVGTVTLDSSSLRLYGASFSEGSFSVLAGGSIRGGGIISSNIDNLGEIVADSTPLSLVGSSTINNGVLRAENNSELYLGGTVSGSVSGSGSIVASNAGAIYAYGPVSQSLIDVREGWYTQRSGLLSTPEFLGDLTIDGGSFSPNGLSTGHSTISGDLTLLSGSLSFQIAGRDVGEYDSIDVGGDATLNGTFEFSFLNGFAPDAGDVWELLQITGTRSGTFGLSEGQALATIAGQDVNITFAGGMGNDVALYAALTPGSKPIALAGSSDAAFLVGTRDTTSGGTVTPPPMTLTYGSLDLLSGSAFTLAPNETLNLLNGPLYVGSNAVFTGNGIINGDVINAGLVRIPIVGVSQVYGGHVQVSLPDTPMTPITINTSTYVEFDSSLVPSGPIVVDTPQITNNGTFVVSGYDASLEVTGTYTQTETGKLRMFIGGDQQGVTYSLLSVGELVTLSGSIEVVLQPELFGYVPSVGDFFDLVESPTGIVLGDDFSLTALVTVDGQSYVPWLDTASYESGITADPDHLLRIHDNLWSYQLVSLDNGGTAFRVTLVAIPAPSSAALLGAGVLAASRRRRQAYFR